MRRHRQELQPFTEMNVTNLLDTAFTLLMAFMIVAPSIKHGIDLEVPQTQGEIIDKDETKTVTVVIRKGDGEADRIYITDTAEEENAREVNLEELSRDLELTRMTYPTWTFFWKRTGTLPTTRLPKPLARSKPRASRTSAWSRTRSNREPTGSGRPESFAAGTAAAEK